MNSPLLPRYEQEKGPDRPSWDEYELQAKAEFVRLLDSDPSEALVQDFLEHNPSFVPGALTPGLSSGHYPLHGALISKPRLIGLRGHEPDFMWLATHSLAWYPTLIEIERPGKILFTRDGVPRAEFTQARNQLAEWRAWFNSPANVAQFVESYGLPPHFRGRAMQLAMILIYGRRTEFEGRSDLVRQRGALMPGTDEQLMSFDRLVPDPKMEEAITIRATGDGRYEVVALPPIFGTSPALAERFLSISGFEQAIDGIPAISRDRKEFLKRRVHYWQEWGKGEGKVVAPHYFLE